MPRKTALLFAFCLFLVVAAYRTVPAAAPQFRERERSQAEQEMIDKNAREANKKRQQEIKSDTDKLFHLATELKEAVDKSNENTLSLDVVRKADEVEKLAKRVKEKMKEAVGPPVRVEPVPRTFPTPPR
ncbi:MAG: hypothetical protein LAO20_08325 [Acidobacteriia bacterium]|nr:hypothetical protein [Terriglobia bacterium]